MNPSTMDNAPLSIGACAALACLWEVTAPKPGNVYPGGDFEDATYAHFITSAAVAAPLVEETAEHGVGATVLAAVRATRRSVGTNTNLGTILLLAPLAGVPQGKPLAEGVDQVLSELDSCDTHCVYQAIREARAGGLGRADVADVHAEDSPDLPLVDAMRLAADHDLIARQYTNGFAQVFGCSAGWIEAGARRGWGLGDSIIHAHVRLIAERPDSLIARKCGLRVAQEASDRAAALLELGTPGAVAYQAGLADLDSWLRADGHRRNPGTSADLIAAGLFVLLREGRLNWPVSF